MVPSKASATIHLRRWRAYWSGYVLAGQQDAGAPITDQHAVARLQQRACVNGGLRC